jgi:hypothetical protein
MKFMRLLLVIMAAAVITLALGGNALAFHGDGVAHCDGCHTMHNSQNGISDVYPGSDFFLLQQVDPTSTCLECHNERGQFSGGEGYGGAGDFYWVTKTWTWTAHGSENNSYGDTHGHNVISQLFGLTMESINATGTSPGGDYPYNNLRCSSCHDPHGGGNIANERLLRGSGNEPMDAPNGWVDPPLMKVTSSRTTVGSGGEATNSNHTAYGLGMGAWCANCHSDMLNAANMHPADHNLGSPIALNYNSYRATGDTGYGNADAYLELTPFARTAAPVNDDRSRTDGPVSSDEVMCLSCHRSHATAFQDIGRWDFTEEYIADSHPNGDDDLSSAADKTNSYYGRTFTADGTAATATSFPSDQRSLCNKCHGKDS